MISIIIPTLNEENYIEATLKQYLPFKKKFKLELIVSDGGSTDKTVTIAQKYADKVVSHKIGTPRNISSGRNHGAEVAKGDILFNTDADVRIMDPDKFFSEIYSKFKDSTIIAATAPLAIYPEEERTSDKFIHFLMNALIRFSVFIKYPIARGECEIIRRESFIKFRYDEKYPVGEDVDLFRRLRKEGRVIYLSKLLVYQSPRRFRKKGYLWFVRSFFTNLIPILFFGRPKTKKWEVIR